MRTVEAIVDERGRVRLLENVSLPQARRALLTILEEPPIELGETACLSGAALAEDWDRPEEDTAWAHLQQGQWCLSPFLFPIYRT